MSRQFAVGSRQFAVCSIEQVLQDTQSPFKVSKARPKKILSNPTHFVVHSLECSPNIHPARSLIYLKKIYPL